VKARKGRTVLSTLLIQNVALLFILLALSFFFSGSETALFSLPRVAVDRLKQTSAAGRRLADLLERPNQLLVTILLGNLAANILVSEIVGVWAFSLSGSFPYSDFIVSIAAILLTTIILLIFAEIAPKTLAINNSERFALGITIPLQAFARFVYPVIQVVLLLTESILRMLGVQKGETDSVVTEEELKTLIAMSEEEGVLESQERLMIHRIIEFGDTLVRDVFIPRTDMVSVKHDISIAQLIDMMIESGHSRFPVRGETVDDIRGIIYAKDLFNFFRRGHTNIPISHFIRPAYYVPDTKKVRDLLREFQGGRLHMAIVVGEYGGTKGLVTLEDLIEEVVGEIFDEYDVKQTEIERLDDDTLRVDARLRLDDLSEVLGVNVRAPECDTVGGLILEFLEHVPETNEYIEHEGFRFVVEAMEDRSITTVHILPVPAETSETDGEADS
jgi:CBS domain containing-hemolysin-like protein